jgi:hypothetical protein
VKNHKMGYDGVVGARICRLPGCGEPVSSSRSEYCCPEHRREAARSTTPRACALTGCEAPVVGAQVYCGAAHWTEARRLERSRVCALPGCDQLIVRGAREFCSREHYQAARAKARERTCERCGKTFTLPPGGRERRFCGRQCSGAARSTEIERRCQHCGKGFDFRPSPTVLERGNTGLYCSKDCFDAARRKHDRPAEMPCERCGAIFKTSGRPPGMPRYCSRACHQAATRVTLTCQGCGEQFTVPRYRGHAKYCSVRCAGRANGDANRKPRETKTCGACRRQFEVRPCEAHIRYCSAACGAIGRRRSVEWVCVCGTVLTLKRAQAARRRYCSRACCGRQHRSERVEIVCARRGCGLKIHAPPSWTGRRYCSMRCRRMAERRRAARVRCAVCKRLFDTRPWQKQRFCSFVCRNRGRDRRPDEDVARRNARILELHATGLTPRAINGALVGEDPAWFSATTDTIRQVVSRARRATAAAV